MPTYKQDIKATTGNSPVNQVAGAASSFNPDQSMAGYILQQGGGVNGMVSSMQNYINQKKQALNASQGIANGNGKGVGVLSGAAAQRSSQATGAVPGSSGDISELSDRVSALEQGGANAPTDGQGALAESTNAVFPNSAQNAAQGMFGSTDQRQNSVGASALFQRTSTPDNDEPTTYDDRLNFKGETQSQIINKADKSNSVERSEFVRDSIKVANKKIDKAIYNLKNPKMKMTQTFGKIKKI